MQKDQLFKEPYRPQYHYTPKENWLNDPNGLVYYDGKYHMFYQYYPLDNIWGPMHWGHAISQDLLHWEECPIAFYPDQLGMIFSGSIVVDRQDTSGFFNGKEGLVALYTNALEDKENGISMQQQSIQYSKDGGETWQPYAHNPVISTPGFRDFRDPKVLWYKPLEKWIMTLACNDHVRFYGSTDLKNWKYLSSFYGEQGCHDGVWECPELFSLPVDGDSDKQKWILKVDVIEGAPAGGSGGQYYIGHFDGKEFHMDAPEAVHWLDYGKDFYAAQSWYGISEQDGRCIWIAWMSNWKYANQIPTQKWRGAMTLPREVQLQTTKKGVQLIQKPIGELKNLREKGNEWAEICLQPGQNLLENISGNTLEIKASFIINNAVEFGFKVCKSEKEETVIGYNAARKLLYVDRTQSGACDFSTEFVQRYDVLMEPIDDRIDLHIFVDASSVEVFANGGKVVLTNLIFPDSKSDSLEIFTTDGEVEIENLEVYSLKESMGIGVKK